MSVIAALLLQDSNGFSSNSAYSNSIRRASQRTSSSRVEMVSTTSTGGNFFDDFNPQRRDGSDGQDASNNMNTNRNQIQDGSTDKSSSKFVTGDDLHRLRHQVLAMRLELQEARRNDDADRIRDLERAIMKTQQVDAEFVYTVSLERQQLAQQAGDLFAAQRFNEKAMEARAALPQFQLEGLWVGKYGEEQGYEMINVTYHGDTLYAHKVTSGTKHVPRGAETFRVDLSPQFGKTNRASPDSFAEEQHEVLSPIELGDSAAKQWGCKYLQRFAGQGQVASEGYQDSQWMEGQLILVNEYFSFAWLPIGHQVFFGRPTPELILKLMKDENKRETVDDPLSPARSFLEKCWEETEHIEDDMEVECHHSTSFFYDEDGCFE